MIDPVLWERLAAERPEDVSERSKCRWDGAGVGYVVPMLGGEYLVRPGDRSVETVRPALPDEKPPGFVETLLLVTYLLSSKDVPPEGNLVPPDRLPDGMFYFRGLHEVPVGKLAERFGGDPRAFARAGKRLGAEAEGYGDASFTWRAFPRVAVTFVLWKGDEEFPARASVLFDSGVHRQMALDALGGAASLAIKRIVAAADA